MLDKLEQLNIQQQQHFASSGMPGISSILAQPVPTSDTCNTNLGLGLGFTFPAPPSTGQTAIITPFNTPARPLAPKPIVTYLDPALIQMKLNSLGVPPLTPPYDEDTDNKEEMNDNTPLHHWLQYRIEESKRREEYEKESSDVLMSASPESTVKNTAAPAFESTPSTEHSPAEEIDSEHGDDVMDDGEDEDQEDIIILSQGKRVSVQESCAIATLKRRSRLMGLHKEAGSILNEGLPIETEVDEFGMKIDGVDSPEVNEAEIAMNEDRSVSNLTYLTR